MLQSGMAPRVSAYAKVPPVLGIGLLSHCVLPVPAHGVPRCPLNSYKICTFKEMAQKCGLWSSSTHCAGQHLSPQWLHLSGVEDCDQAFIGGGKKVPMAGLVQSWSCIHSEAVSISCFKCPRCSSDLQICYAWNILHICRNIFKGVNR